MISKRTYPGIIAAIIVLIIGCATPSYAVQVRMLAWSSQDGDLQFDANRKATRLKLFPDTFSTAMEMKDEGPITLYKMVADKDGNPHKQVACTLVIPPGMEQGLLILIPGDQTKAVDHKVLPDESGFVSAGAPLIYDYIWLDDSPKVRPPGTIEFRNMSRLPIAIQVEQAQIMLAPKGKAQVPLTAGAKRMAFRGAAQIDGQWKFFRSHPLSTRSPDRMLVILREGSPPAQGSGLAGEPDISMISLYDWPAPPAAPAAGPMLSANRR